MSGLRGTVFTQRGSITDGRIEVPAGVDFAPSHLVRPAPDSAFPPVEARPGSIAREGCSPLVELADGTVLNAPVIASASGALGRTVWYISTEATDPMVAAMEGATWAPATRTARTGGLTW